MNTKEHLAELISSQPAGCEGIFSKIADSFEDELLEFDDFPDEYFGFFLELLVNPEVYSKPGLWEFFLIIGTESHRMTDAHYEAISKTLIENYQAYENHDLCLAVCDFIARNYPYNQAKNILLRLKSIESRKTENLHGFALDGIRILENAKARENFQ